MRLLILKIENLEYTSARELFGKREKKEEKSEKRKRVTGKKNRFEDTVQFMH